MQEFSSVSASAYDADSLTTQLGEKSAEGWDVLSIVTAGTNVVAYLSREASDDAAPVEETVAEEVVVEEEVEPAEEPAGWAAAPDDANADPTPTDAAAVATGIVAADAATAEPSTADAPAADDAAPAEPESAVPAGWYSDPSSRFELRYWDGGAWTEHVSRAGQQYTDPPVA